MGAQIIDVTHVQAPKQCNTEEEKAAINYETLTNARRRSMIGVEILQLHSALKPGLRVNASYSQN